MKCTTANFKSISPGYKTALKEVGTQISNGKLVLYNPIPPNHQYVALIFIPQSLRSTDFSHLHTGPSGGHMGGYKTIYRMQLRLSWDKLREDVKQWVKGCDH